MEDYEKELALQAKESIVETMFFEHSMSIANIADALSKAQAVMAPAVMNKTAAVKYRDKNTGQYIDKSYKYADLQSVWDSIRSPLTGNGLAVVQFPSVRGTGEGQEVTVVTRLVHSSGEFFGCTVTLTGFDRKVQTSGSLMTYGRRYGISCLTGVVSEEDDDGDAGMKSDAGMSRKSVPETKKVTPPPPKKSPKKKEDPPPPPEPAATRWAGTPMNDTERGRLGLLSCAKIQHLGDEIIKKSIPKEAWLEWLLATYGYETIYKIEDDVYNGVLATVETTPEQIINFKVAPDESGSKK